jgi:serine/threonine-protein kinase
MSLNIGEAGYRIIEPIANGGMGQVFKAEHVITKRIEAVKILSGAGTEQETQRFLREIQLQASLSHPNIAAVYNAFPYENDLVMVMELVEGETLRTVLQKGPLAPDVAVRYASQVLDAIGYAHAHGVIHRDISPSNIVITPPGNIKLKDFGLAKASAAPSASESGSCLGSPHYMSPEQVKDAMRASASSDIYSVGAVLYEMVTGRTVFQSDSSFAVMQAHVESAPTPPSQINPALPAAVNAAILKALEKDPAKRFATAGEFRHAIQGPVQALVLAAPVEPKSWARRLTPAVPFAATCAVILLPTVFYVHSRRQTATPKTAAPRAVIELAPAPPAVGVEPPPVAEPPSPSPSARPTKPVAARRPIPRRIFLGVSKPDPTPRVFGEERRPPSQGGMELVQPAPAPTASSVPNPETVAAVPNPLASENAAAAESPVAAEGREHADEPTEKKPRGRFRRALGKIFGTFAK